MPYIKQEQRDMFRLGLDEIKAVMDTFDYNSMLGSGALNFLVSSICKDFLSIKGKNYENLNSIIGALDCAKEEFRRRVINPYEDIKIKENNDL
jgi:hypothetical protein